MRFVENLGKKSLLMIFARILQDPCSEVEGEQRIETTTPWVLYKYNQYMHCVTNIIRKVSTNNLLYPIEWEYIVYIIDSRK